MPGDTNYASVSAAMDFRGTNGRRYSPDLGPLALDWLFQGDAKLTTSQTLNGKPMLQLNGSDAALFTPANAAFNFGTATDFCIESYIYPTARVNNYGTLIGSGVNPFGTTSFFVILYGDSSPATAQRGKLGVGNFGANPLLLSTTTLALNTLYHIQISRVGTSLRLFVNGTLEASATSSTFTFDLGSSGTYIGRNGWDGGAGFLSALLGPIRVTKSAGRDTTNFTPTPELLLQTQVSGTVVSAAGTAVSRTLRAYRRDNGDFVGQATSNATTGAYTINLPTNQEVTVVCLDDAAGTVENDRTHRVTPA